ncbi:xanthine dehydrogenase family protein subunit M [Pseudonocardia kongjuensis]|uniref:Xanthine dehydrogenase family protein subunit M n=1 Tax=Pseudonocardia kongjuensis TaxID=102227 RepID=A0ABP4IG15_9PSEU
MNHRSYAAPGTLAEALDLLADRPGTRPVAGGTDLVVAARGGKAPLPGSLLALHRIDELRGLHADDAGLTIGAGTSHATLTTDPAVRDRWSALSDASALVGSPATRATGTLGGNLMNASPAMDTGSPLLVLGARIGLRRAGGHRTLPVERFLTGPGRTAAAPDELLTEVTVPAPAPRSGSAYVRLEHRRAMEIAVVGAAAAVTLDPAGRFVAAAVALTAVAPTCLLVPGIGDLLAGRHPDPEALALAGATARASVRPISDVRAGAGYRAAMVAVLVGRALTAAAGRARNAPHIPAGRTA